MFTEQEFRDYVGRLIRGYVPETATTEEAAAALEDRVAWLEKAWFDSHAENMTHRRKGWLQRQEATGAHDHITDDPHAEAYVVGLLGPGFCFSQPEDYQLAVQLAVRAYRDGMAGKTLATPHYGGTKDDLVASDHH